MLCIFSGISEESSYDYAFMAFQYNDLCEKKKNRKFGTKLFHTACTCVTREAGLDIATHVGGNKHIHLVRT